MTKKAALLHSLEETRGGVENLVTFSSSVPDHLVIFDLLSIGKLVIFRFGSHSIGNLIFRLSANLRDWAGPIAGASPATSSRENRPEVPQGGASASG